MERFSTNLNLMIILSSDVMLLHNQSDATSLFEIWNHPVDANGNMKTLINTNSDNLPF